MIDRRNLVIGAACVAAAGTAYALKPRRHVSLLGRRLLEDIVPKAFGEWSSQQVSNLVAPKKEEGTLAAKLYSQTVERTYRNVVTGAEVMTLIAHGDTQSDALQFHRPEICYPAFGFAITQNQPTQLSLPGGARIPARHLVADGPGRREVIVYWSRLGEYLPIDGGEQRRDRLKTAMAGNISDGLLARFSLLGASPETSFAVLDPFVAGLIMATRPDQRDALIGTQLATKLT